jgi:L-threonylcarbamoyladenylate synthase
MTTDNRHKPLGIQEQYRQAHDVLRSGGIVALPTDTVYGLIAVAADRAAVERVYEVKVRDPRQPMPLFVATVEQALIAEVNDVARRLMQRFWPGALTIVLRKKPSYETRAAAGGDTIGLRAPGDPVLCELASQLGPLTGTSANIAGARNAIPRQVRAQLASRGPDR